MVQSINDISTEGLINRVGNGSPVTTTAGNTLVYSQLYKSTAISNSATETSILPVASLAPQITGSAYVAPTTIPYIPANFLNIGTHLRAKFYGTITNTGTPTVRLRAVLKNAAGTVVYTLSDTTATATTAITGTREAVLEFDTIVVATGATAGSIVGRAAITYGTTAILNTTIKAAPAAVTVDTTQEYYLDVLWTWGAASASNTLTPFFGEVEIL